MRRENGGHGMSYIDREAAIERLCYVCGADCDKNICPVKQTVEYMPDADVEPIKHGEWIKKENKTTYWWECSECGEEPLKDGYERRAFSRYCPNCGAKMEEDTE
jgi:hypothetical protein